MRNKPKKDESYKKKIGGVFLDYTKDVLFKFFKEKSTQVSIKDVKEFIDEWVDKHFEEAS